MKERTRKKIITLVIFLIILIALGYIVGIEYNKWWQVRKEYIKMGYASEKFPFKMYTVEELAEKGLYPESLYEDVPTRTRPEETYVIFRQALIDGDLDKAAECFIKDQQDDWKESLYEIKHKGLLQEMLNDLPEKIENIPTTGSLTSYEYVIPTDPERFVHTITFTKNKDGDWKIDGIY